MNEDTYPLCSPIPCRDCQTPISPAFRLCDACAEARYARDGDAWLVNLHTEIRSEQAVKDEPPLTLEMGQ